MKRCYWLGVGQVWIIVEFCCFYYFFYIVMFKYILFVVVLVVVLVVFLFVVVEIFIDVVGDVNILVVVCVIGFNIKCIDIEVFNLVQVIGCQQLEQIGKVIVVDVLCLILVNIGNVVNEIINNGWVFGLVGIGLCGLLQKNMLVLFNGCCLVNYGFLVGGLFDIFVDFNVLLLVVVECIEVFKDGVLVVYGFDVVVGVVNIIIWQNFEGVEIGGSFGGVDQGGLYEQNLKFVGGFGDLDIDGYNIFFSLQGYNCECLDQDECNLICSGIYIDKFGGCWNGWLVKGVCYLVNGVLVLMFDVNGNCLVGIICVVSVLIDGLFGDICGFNQVLFIMLIFLIKCYQVYVNGIFCLNDNVEVFGEVLYSQIKSVVWFGSSLFFILESGCFVLNVNSGLVELVLLLLLVNNLYNLYGCVILIEYIFFDFGGIIKINCFIVYCGVFGLCGIIVNWDWEVVVFGVCSSECESVFGGFVNCWVLVDVLVIGSYNLLNLVVMLQLVCDLINIVMLCLVELKLQGVDVKIFGSLGYIWVGEIGFVVGVEWCCEKFDFNNLWQIDVGLQVCLVIVEVYGQCQVSVVYVEVNVLLVLILELFVVVCVDYYDDFGDVFLLKIGLCWQLFDFLLVCVLVLKGFCVLLLLENFNSISIVYGSVVDLCDLDVLGLWQNLIFFIVGNNVLKFECIRSVNFGVVLLLWVNINLSVDYYCIQLDNLVGINNIQILVNDNVVGVVQCDECGKLQVVYNCYQNLSELKILGIDVELCQCILIVVFGDFIVFLVYIYVCDYCCLIVVGGLLVDYVGSNLGVILFKDKVIIMLDWKYGDFNVVVIWYYISGYCQEVSIVVKVVQQCVGSYSQYDLYLVYIGIDKLIVYVKVQNLVDKMLLYDVLFLGICVLYDFS